MAALLLALAVMTAHAPSAGATARGTASGTTSGVTSDTWGAIPTTATTGIPAPAALSLSFGASLLVPPPPQYFDVVNSGTRTLDHTGYFVATSGLGIPGPSVTLKACPLGVTWNTSTDLCTGGVTAVVIGSFNGSSSAYIDSSAAPTTAGTHLHVQASLAGSILSSVTAVVSAEVSSSGPCDFVQVTEQ